MPSSTARRMAPTASSSSCGPQAARHPLPPMAQLPKPMRVISIPVLPNARFSKASPFVLCPTDIWSERDRDKRRGVVRRPGERRLGLLRRHPAPLGLDHGPDQAHVPDHGDARDLLARQDERDGRAHVLLLLEGLVPRSPLLPYQGIALGPVAPRDGLYGHEPRVLALYLLDERLEGPAVVLISGENVVPGREHGVERVAAQGLAVRRGGLVSMACDADGPDQTLVSGLN